MKIQTGFVMAMLFAGVFGAEPAAHAQCTAASLSGGWGYLASGTFTDILSGSVEARIESGLFTFDGAGTFTLKNSWSVGGQSTRNAVSRGTYFLNPDCSGTLIIRDGTPDLVHFKIQVNAAHTGFTMACTDFNAQVLNNLTRTYTSTYTGIALQQTSTPTPA